MNDQKTLAVAGKDISEKCRESLLSLGFDLRILPACRSLGKGVDTHADLMLFPIGKKIFIYKDTADSLPALSAELCARGYELEQMSGAPRSEYPYDIGANCLSVGRFIIAKIKYTDEKIKKYAESNGYTLVNVNQGYARCTACPVSENATVTADASIAKAAESCGIDTLRITGENVRLRGYPYGFIGGACGVFEDKIFFTGDLYSHPDGKKIEEFCRFHGKSAVSLSDEPLCDVGSIFFF